MKILSVNAGSSSLKFKMYEMPCEKVLIYGYIEKIGNDSIWKIIKNGNELNYEGRLKNHAEAVKVLIDALLEHNIIKSLNQIDGIGHRIVNGAGKYKPHVIDEKDIQRLEGITSLSPVHMPGQIAGIKAFKKQVPNTKQIALYDTAFHHTIPKENFLYAVPYEWYEKYGVRKFGFHGISCEYITSEMEKFLHKKVNLIICHIGNGASVTLVKNSHSLDNSMGFTANAGLMMGTRCGDIDYSILPCISAKIGKNLKEIDEILNNESGLEGIESQISDNRDLEKAIAEGNKKAILANEMYTNKVAEYIAKYYIKLDKIDAIVFCGGVGENGRKFRAKVISKLHKLGIIINPEINDQISKFSTTNCGIISNENSVVPCYVIPTDEELMIARDTYELVK